MRRIPNRDLYLGHAGDLRDVRAVLRAGVSAIVELADSEMFANLPRDLVRLRFPLSDGGDNPPWLIRLAIDATASLVRAGVPALVCCSAGMSRSVCVAAAALAVAEGRPCDEVLAEIAAAGPADVSPGLWREVRSVVG